MSSTAVKQHKTRRRDPNAHVGYVKWPVTQQASTGEGGMFVRLVVLDTPGDKNFDNKYIPCCGGYQQFHLDECFIGDDLLPAKLAKLPRNTNGKNFAKWYAKYTELHETTERRYFDKETFVSSSVLCVLTIGASGWSNSAFCCTFNDLNREGKALYRSLQKLYPKCEIRLLTFLDT